MNNKERKYNWCKLKIVVFLLCVLLFSIEVAAEPNMSESWHKYVYSQVRCSDVLLDASAINEIDYAYSGSYGEGYLAQSVSRGGMPGSRKLNSDTVILSDEMIEIMSQGVFGFIDGIIPALVFASFSDVDADAKAEGVLCGGFVGMACGYIYAKTMIPVVRDNEARGRFIGVSLGAFLGALSGATGGGLLLKDTPSDEPFSGPEFGRLAGAIFGGVIGAMTGRSRVTSISYYLANKSKKNDERQGNFPLNGMSDIEEKSDSSRVMINLLEIPKPPLSMCKISAEIIGCTYGGYLFGGLSQLLFRENDFAWAVANIWAQGFILSPQGFGERSRYQYVDGSLNCAALFGSLGMFLSHEFIESRPLFIMCSPIVSSIFATVAWNLTRRYENYGVTKTGLLNLNDDRISIGNPSMFIHSTPFCGKEIAYGVDLFKFKF